MRSSGVLAAGGKLYSLGRPCAGIACSAIAPAVRCCRCCATGQTSSAWRSALVASPRTSRSPVVFAAVCRKKTVRKEYMALAVGVPPQAEFAVDAPIDRDEEEQ